MNSTNHHTMEKHKAISKLVGRIVHDLNNISTIVLNVCELLKDDVEGNEDALMKVNMLSESGDKLMAYVEEINSLRLRKVKCTNQCRVDELIKKACQSYTDRANIVFKSNTKDHCALINDKDFTFVLNAIIENGIDAQGDNNTIEIETSCEDSSHFKISIRDYGSGIDKEQQSHLFEPYFTAKDNVKGAGLSLAKSFATMNACGGSIDISSERGQGTTVTLAIPLGEKVSSDKSLKDTAAPVKKQPRVSPCEVLIVDDQDPLRKVASEILKKGGYKVLEASNGVEALEVAEKEGKNISILITDVVMPLMGGRELVTRLHQKHKDMRVLFMSGYTDDGSLIKKDDARMGFVQKPFTKDKLLGAVENILR